MNYIYEDSNNPTQALNDAKSALSSVGKAPEVNNNGGSLGETVKNAVKAALPGSDNSNSSSTSEAYNQIINDYVSEFHTWAK
jgi:hypothetical protein